MNLDKGNEIRNISTSKQDIRRLIEDLSRSWKRPIHKIRESQTKKHEETKKSAHQKGTLPDELPPM
jgi:ribosomal protein L19E